MLGNFFPTQNTLPPPVGQKSRKTRPNYNDNILNSKIKGAFLLIFNAFETGWRQCCVAVAPAWQPVLYQCNTSAI